MAKLMALCMSHYRCAASRARGEDSESFGGWQDARFGGFQGGQPDFNSSPTTIDIMILLLRDLNLAIATRTGPFTLRAQQSDVETDFETFQVEDITG